MIQSLLRRHWYLPILSLLLAWPALTQAEPAIWRIKGEHATIWLFGTVHVLKPGTDWQSPALKEAMAKADALWLEIPDSNPETMQPLIVRYGIDQAHPLSSKIAPDDRTRLDALLSGMGQPAGSLDPLRPWFAGLMLGMMPIVRAGYDPASGVEKALGGAMRTAGKPVNGLETAEQQIRYLADLKPETELAFFHDALVEVPEALTKLDALIKAWTAGDEAALETQLNGELRDHEPELYQRLIVERNHHFAAAIAELARGKGTVLVAVGAGHLVGSESVRADLAAMGLVAERIHEEPVQGAARP